MEISKKELRLLFKEIRENISDKLEKSRIITQKFIETDIYKNSQNIMLFYPKENEVYTLYLLEEMKKDGKTAIFPVTDKENHHLTPYLYNGAFVKGAFNIYEPFSSEIFPKKSIDAVIAPALSSDKDNFRLGYGGGFYDRFLSDFNGKIVTFIFKDLITEKLPCEKTDIRANLVITE